MYAPAPPSAAAGARPSLGLVLLLGALTAFGAVSIDLYLPAIPAIAAHFETSVGHVQTSMAAFFLGMALGQLVLGPLSDRVGRRPPLLAGALLYTLASLFCMGAPSADALIAGRFAQALGACAGVVVARAVVRDRFDTVEGARLYSLLFLVLGVAPMLAPSLGALLLAAFGWQAIFAALAAFGALVGLAVLVGLPESRTAETARVAAGESPLQSYRAVLADRRLLGFVLAGAFNGAALFAYVAASPGLFIGWFGQSAGDFGWIFALNAAGLIAASQANRWLLNRVSPAAIMARASIVAGVFGLAFVATAAAGVATMPVGIGLIFLGLGSYGFVTANSMALALSLMPARAGAISALIGAASFVFGAAAASLTAPFAEAGPLPLALAMTGGFVGAWAALRWLAGAGRWSG
jgi:DHA1 family bicyclomycin/chloramphenicol resistance-like MFS transporter